MDSSIDPSLYLGDGQEYFIDTNGVGYFSNLSCDTFNFGRVTNFEIVDANDTGFNIQFTYGGRTYKFFPSNSSVTVS